MLELLKLEAIHGKNFIDLGKSDVLCSYETNTPLRKQRIR